MLLLVVITFVGDVQKFSKEYLSDILKSLKFNDHAKVIKYYLKQQCRYSFFI